MNNLARRQQHTGGVNHLPMQEWQTYTDLPKESVPADYEIIESEKSIFSFLRISEAAKRAMALWLSLAAFISGVFVGMYSSDRAGTLAEHIVGVMLAAATLRIILYLNRNN